MTASSSFFISSSFMIDSTFPVPFVVCIVLTVSSFISFSISVVAIILFSVSSLGVIGSASGSGFGSVIIGVITAGAIVSTLFSSIIFLYSFNSSSTFLLTSSFFSTFY